MMRFQSSSILTILALVSIIAAADEPAGPLDRREQQRFERLESMPGVQKARIDDLQSELAAAGAQNQNAARADVMKQQIREVLGETLFRESLMPATVMAGYDKGFFIRSSDDTFYMRMNGRVEFRLRQHSGSSCSSLSVADRHFALQRHSAERPSSSSLGGFFFRLPFFCLPVTPWPAAFLLGFHFAGCAGSGPCLFIGRRFFALHPEVWRDQDVVTGDEDAGTEACL